MAAKEDLGRRIREIREAGGLKQKDAARLAGLEPSRLSNYEAGTREPSVVDLERMAKAWQCDLEDFFRKDDAPLRRQERILVSLWQHVPHSLRPHYLALLRAHGRGGGKARTVEGESPGLGEEGRAPPAKKNRKRGQTWDKSFTS